MSAQKTPFHPLLTEAEAAHRRGQFAPAEALYRRVLSEQPGHVQAMALLGLLCAQQQRFAEALPLFRAVVEARPEDALARINLGETLRRLGQPEAARQELELAVRLAPEQPDAWLNLGQLLSAEQPESARAAFERALALNASHARARAQLAALLLKQEQPEPALAQLETALELGQRSAQNLVNYALAHQLAAKGPDNAPAAPRLPPEQLRACFLEALQRQPDYLPAIGGLAAFEFAQGQLEAAYKAYERLVNLQPAQAGAWLGLADSLSALGWPGRAIECLKQGCRRVAAAERAALLDRIASLFFQLKEIELTAQHYAQALELEPERLSSLHGLATLHERQGELARATEYYARIQALKPESDLLRLHRELLLPVMLPDCAAVETQEVQLHAVLDRWLDQGLRAEPGDLPFFTGQASFMYTYHTRGSGRALREKFARLFRPLLPRWEPLRRKGAQPHVGFLVTPGHEFIFAKSVCGLLNHFDSAEIRYSVICPRAGFELYIRPQLRNPAIEWIDLPARIEQAAEAVRQARLDILNFWEIATDTLNFLLPFYRLAPVQTLSWGWPLTSGNPEVDYYLSASHLEAGAGQTAYTEQLHCFSLLPAYYYRPQVPARLRSRAELGLSEHEQLYFCSQNLFKLHPDYDQALRGILTADPRGRVLLLEDKLPAVTASLRARLEGSCAGLSDRISWLPRRPLDEYLNLVAVSDLVIDPYHYVGANTSFDAFALGVPVLTLPSDYHRGRHSFAAYDEMGLYDGVALDREDYVSRAVALATDRERRQALVEGIGARCEVLFENPRIVNEYEAFFKARLAELG